MKSSFSLVLSRALRDDPAVSHLHSYRGLPMPAATFAPSLELQPSGFYSSCRSHSPKVGGNGPPKRSPRLSLPTLYSTSHSTCYKYTDLCTWIMLSSAIYYLLPSCPLQLHTPPPCCQLSLSPAVGPATAL